MGISSSPVANRSRQTVAFDEQIKKFEDCVDYSNRTSVSLMHPTGIHPFCLANTSVIQALKFGARQSPPLRR